MINHYNLKRKSSHDASFSTRQKLNPADIQDLQVPSQPATDTLNLPGVTSHCTGRSLPHWGPGLPKFIPKQQPRVHAWPDSCLLPGSLYCL